jgi:hypothetical protein
MQWANLLKHKIPNALPIDGHAMFFMEDVDARTIVGHFATTIFGPLQQMNLAEALLVCVVSHHNIVSKETRFWRHICQFSQHASFACNSTKPH